MQMQQLGSSYAPAFVFLQYLSLIANFFSLERASFFVGGCLDFLEFSALDWIMSIMWFNIELFMFERKFEEKLLRKKAFNVEPNVSNMGSNTSSAKSR